MQAWRFIKLDLVAVDPNWTKVWQQADPAGKDNCVTGRVFGQSAQQPSLTVMIYQASEEKRFARFNLPLGLLLRPGFRLVIDKSEPIEGHYVVCFQGACIGEADLSAANLNALKKGSNLAIITRNSSNTEVTFNAADQKEFGAAFEEPGGRSQGDRAAERLNCRSNWKQKRHACSARRSRSSRAPQRRPLQRLLPGARASRQALIAPETKVRGACSASAPIIVNQRRHFRRRSLRVKFTQRCFSAARSIVLGAGVWIAIERGLLRLGTSRTRSMCSRPFSDVAFTALT